MKRIFGVVALVGILAGCASIDTVEQAALTDGISQSFNANYDSVSGATLKGLSTLNVTVRSSDKTDGGMTLLVSKAVNAFSWGEVGRIYIERSVTPPTKVFVVWEKRSQLQITGTSAEEFSKALFNAVSASLAK